MFVLYEIAIRVMHAGIWLASLFHPKASLWMKGRVNWRHELRAKMGDKSAKVLWVHAASLGEFEQGRPVIEAWREKYPEWKIVLSFYSPSGYEIRKNYAQADVVCYLPADTRQNARDFLDILQPDVAIFVKYEFWANYLAELRNRSIMTYLVSALFRPEQPFFKAYGGFWRRMLGCFTHFFVQNETSGKLLQSIGIQNVTVAGDTRIDRVLKLAESVPENVLVKDFVGSETSQTLVVGSSWEADEKLLFEIFQQGSMAPIGFNKRIIAPHDPSETNVTRICQQAKQAVRYTQYEPTIAADWLVIDNVGMLNSLYQYGAIAYIGGGFGKGIHNTLEPAAFGLPIIFGPKYQKFEEARQFVARGGAFSVQNSDELRAVLLQLQDPVFYQKASKAVSAYLTENRGATTTIMNFGF